MAFKIFATSFEIVQRPFCFPVNPSQDTFVFTNSMHGFPVDGIGPVFFRSFLFPKAQGSIRYMAVSYQELRPLVDIEFCEIVRFTGLKQLNVIAHDNYCQDVFTYAGDLTLEYVQPSDRLAYIVGIWSEQLPSSGRGLAENGKGVSGTISTATER